MLRIKCVVARDFNLLRHHLLFLLDIVYKVTLANILNLFNDLLSKLSIDYSLWNH